MITTRNWQDLLEPIARKNFGAGLTEKQVKLGDLGDLETEIRPGTIHWSYGVGFKDWRNVFGFVDGEPAPASRLRPRKPPRIRRLMFGGLFTPHPISRKRATSQIKEAP